ncbi:hypothetical protein J5N97_028658 [Dioscorea zingiberensis]|uniref:Uncharacterized protein n=1 Tax=Dioscorea zingiberensis TaxID=325984 RepID=A0A9D5BZF0_9LILI|nr:hypothetical protein J5N97_028658 [Dioscorea zingiberensis]
MALQARLLEFKLHIAAAVATVAAVISLFLHGPSLSTILTFFWPLLLSTGCFLAVVALVLRIAPPPSGITAGEELIDYVAGQPEESTGELKDDALKSQ